MKNIVKQSLAKFFSLPLDFISDEANLYILSILSLYFKKEQAERDNIRTSDVDIKKLSLSRSELVMDEEGSRLDIYLSKLLKKDLSTEVRAKAYYKDHIGRDGFSGNVLETVLCIMEISDAFNSNFMEFTEEDDTNIKVIELIEFVLRKNLETNQNPRGKPTRYE